MKKDDGALEGSVKDSGKVLECKENISLYKAVQV